MRIIQGSCHCGNISYRLSWPVDDSGIPARACSCTFCIKHRGVYTSHPEARLVVKVKDGPVVSRYRFGTGTADFAVCSRCGVVPFVTSTIEGRLYAIVNVNTFDGVDRSEFEETVTDFDGESVADRLARRQRNWIPEVEVIGLEPP